MTAARAPGTAPAQDAGALIPSRPLAAQAHALRAAAAFIERTGLAGLSVGADAHGIHVLVPGRFGGPATRTAAVTFLAAALGGLPARHHARAFCLVSARGQIAGHDAWVTTSIGCEEEAP